jgi:hypothetical protein
MQTTPQKSMPSGKGVVLFREMTTLETALDCYRREGPKTFLAGLTPTLIRAVPVNIMSFATFEIVVGLLTARQHH